MTVLLLLAGFVLLVAGAEVLVRGSSQIATRAGISPLVVGLTVVAFGTSAPELAVSIGAGLSGQADIALGNVVGSNVFNVLLILGASALIAPLAVSNQLVRLDVPLMVGLSGLVWVLAVDGRIGGGDGLLLVAGVVAYTVGQIVLSRRGTAQEKTAPSETAPSETAASGETDVGQSAVGSSAQPDAAADAPVEGSSTDPQGEEEGGSTSIGVSLGMVAVGLGVLVLGARWLVQGAMAVAEAAGMSELVIGLTIVAGGTSLPELATSVLASLRGEREIAVGNVVGSNVFNLLAVLGVTATVSGGIAVPSGALWFDLPVMIAVAIACLPIFRSDLSISRWEGGLFVGYYVVYTVYLVLTAVEHPLVDTFELAMLGIVLPLTALGLLRVGVRGLRSAD